MAQYRSLLDIYLGMLGMALVWLGTNHYLTNLAWSRYHPYRKYLSRFSLLACLCQFSLVRSYIAQICPYMVDLVWSDLASYPKYQSKKLPKGPVQKLRYVVCYTLPLQMKFIAPEIILK